MVLTTPAAPADERFCKKLCHMEASLALHFT
jgi:hypothetical protein